MITIKHNFSSENVKFICAKYVDTAEFDSEGCLNLIGSESLKLTMKTIADGHSTTEITFDEVQNDGYAYIVIKGNPSWDGYAGELHRAYFENIFVAIRPEEDAHDNWDFEKWHVEIFGGKIQPIPFNCEVYKNPITEEIEIPKSLEYRWAFGAFYPHYMIDLHYGLPQKLEVNNIEFDSLNVVKSFIQYGFTQAKLAIFEPEKYGNYNLWEEHKLDNKITPHSYEPEEELHGERLAFRLDRSSLFDRNTAFHSLRIKDISDFRGNISTRDAKGISKNIPLKTFINSCFSFEFAEALYRIGVNEFLDLICPRQVRDMLLNPREDLSQFDMHLKLRLSKLANYSEEEISASIYGSIYEYALDVAESYIETNLENMNERDEIASLVETFGEQVEEALFALGSMVGFDKTIFPGNINIRKRFFQFIYNGGVHLIFNINHLNTSRAMFVTFCFIDFTASYMGMLAGLPFVITTSLPALLTFTSPFVPGFP